MSIILLIIGLLILIKAASIFVDGCSNVAKALKIPSIIVGLTIVALGTSTPEAVVSINASLKGMNDMALGNVIGSNIFNIVFVLGFSSVIAPFSIAKHMIIDLIVMVAFLLPSIPVHKLPGCFVRPSR